MMNKWFFGLQLLILFLVGTFFAQPVAAATIVVDTTDHEAPFVNNGNCTLGEALQAARDNVAQDGCVAGSGSADTITLPAGTWDLHTAVGSAWHAGQLCVLPTIIDTITLSGAGMATTILDAGGVADGSTLCVTLNATLRLENLTVQNGTTLARGGGVSMLDDSVLETENVRFFNNSGDVGGAISGENSRITLTNSELIDNTARYGGGVYGGEVSADNTLFQANSVAGNNNHGGGIFATTIALTNSQFNDNSATRGGAVTVLSGGSIAGTTFEENVGGGIVACNAADLTITDSEFTQHNLAIITVESLGNCAGVTSNLPLLSISQSGFYSNTGTIDNQAFRLDISESQFAHNSNDILGQSALAGATQIERSVFHHNSGTDIFNSNYPFTVRQSAFYDNSGELFVPTTSTLLLDRVTIANNDGHAIVPSQSADVTLDRSTVVNTTGFAIMRLHSSTSATIQRSVIAGSNATHDVAAGANTPISSGGGNVIGVATGMTNIAADDLIGSQASPVDAQLDLFQETGPNIWDWTAAPLPGSPAIDRIALVANRMASCTAGGQDQRDEAWDIDYDRDLTVKCDSGAHERQADEQFRYLLTNGETRTFGATLATINATTINSRNETLIVRHNVTPTGVLSETLPTYWQVSPTVSNVDLSMTLCYTDWEVAQNPNVDETQLSIWREVGGVWMDIGRSAIDTQSNCVTQTGLTTFGGNYALAEQSTVTAVALLSADVSALQPFVTVILVLSLLTATITQLRIRDAKRS